MVVGDMPGLGAGPSPPDVLEADPDARAVLAAVRDGSGAVVDFRVLAVNARVCEFLGLGSCAEVVGQLLTRVASDEAQRIGVYAEVLAGGAAVVRDRVEVAQTSEVGPRLVDFGCYRVDADHLKVVVRDVTGMVRAEQALRDSEVQFRSAMDTSPIGMCLIGEAGEFLHVNAALCELLGRDEPTLHRCTWQELTHPEDLDVDEVLAGEVQQGLRDSYRIRKRYLRPDGSIVWGDLSVCAVRGSDGRFMHYISQIVDISDLLTASRQQYQLLAENASDIVFRSNTALEMQWLSPSVTEVLGWEPQDLVGRPVADIVHPQDRPVLEQSVLDSESGRPASYRARFICRDGSYRWLAITARPIYDTGGRLVGRIGSGRDVTPEQVAADALAVQHAYMQAVLDSELDPRVLVVPVCDDSGAVIDLEYTDANEQAVAYFAVVTATLVGSRMLELFPGQRRSGLFDAYLNTLTTGQPLVIDAMQVSSEVSESTEWIDLRAVRVHRGISVTWRDVTERHRAQTALRDSEQRFRLMAENTSDIVSLANADGMIRWVSPSLTRTLGWHTDQWTGHRVDEFLHPDDLDAARKRRSAVTDEDVVTGRVRLRDSHGTYHWAETRISTFHDDQGAPHGVMALVTLVDALVAKEEALRHRASHDPLTGLLTRDEIYRRLAALLDHAPRTGTLTYLAFIDMDNLKAVNDEHGHAAGDELLRVVAQRTRDLIRDGDHIARIGGDEILVILPGMQDGAAALNLMTRLIAATTRPHTFAGTTLTPRMSIGLTEVLPGDDIEAAVHRADTAMYEAKAAGGNQTRLVHRHP